MTSSTSSDSPGSVRPSNHPHPLVPLSRCLLAPQARRQASHNDIMMMSDHDEETYGRDVAKTHYKGPAIETWPISRAPSRVASRCDVADVTKQRAQALSFYKTSGRRGWGCRLGLSSARGDARACLGWLTPVRAARTTPRPDRTERLSPRPLSSGAPGACST